jgi:hypothetical protein
MAILTSSQGFSGRDLSLASPPMGKSVMSPISIPSLWATIEWPYSCRSTQTKSATMMPTVTSALNGSPEFW